MQQLEHCLVKSETAASFSDELNVLDILTDHKTSCVLYFFRKTPEVARMKAALQGAVDRHPSIGGALFHENSRIYLKHNVHGVVFSFFDAERPATEIDWCSPILEDSPLLEPAPASEDVLSGKAPVLYFRLTRFEDDRCALGIRLVHSVTDGVTLLGFMNCWAALYRGDDAPAANSHPRAAINELAIGNGHKPSPRFSVMPPPNFDFGKEMAENRANYESDYVELDDGGVQRLMDRLRANQPELSRSDVLHAMLWKAFAVFSDKDDQDLSRIYSIFDLRSVPGLDIPIDYEGNAVFERYATLRFGALRRSSLEEIANAYRTQIKPITAEEARQDIAFLKREQMNGSIGDKTAFYTRFSRASLADCLSGTGIYVNDMRNLKTYAVTFEVPTLRYELRAALGFAHIAIHRSEKGNVAIRYSGPRATLKQQIAMLVEAVR